MLCVISLQVLYVAHACCWLMMMMIIMLMLMLMMNTYLTYFVGFIEGVLLGVILRALKHSETSRALAQEEIDRCS